jgi:hypothetical protein
MMMPFNISIQSKNIQRATGGAVTVLALLYPKRDL